MNRLFIFLLSACLMISFHAFAANDKPMDFTDPTNPVFKDLKKEVDDFDKGNPELEIGKTVLNDPEAVAKMRGGSCNPVVWAYMAQRAYQSAKEESEALSNARKPATQNSSLNCATLIKPEKLVSGALGGIKKFLKQQEALANLVSGFLGGIGINFSSEDMMNYVGPAIENAVSRQIDSVLGKVMDECSKVQGGLIQIAQNPAVNQVLKRTVKGYNPNDPLSSFTPPVRATSEKSSSEQGRSTSTPSQPASPPAPARQVVPPAATTGTALPQTTPNNIYR